LSLLTDQKFHLTNLPHVADISNLVSLLQELGVERNSDGSLRAEKIRSTVAPYDLVRKMRASILVLGPLLARAHQAEVSLPGGCAIGERPVDIHLAGLKALGAEIEVEGGYIKAKASRLKGARFVMHFPSVTGTINLVSAAVLAQGETCFENVAREPEVVEICEALRAMGAEIEGEGSSRILIQGKEKLNGLTWEIQPDRIQLLTYLAAAAITGGELTCSPYRKNTLNAVLQKFQEMGAEIIETEKSVRLKSKAKLQPIRFETAPFPGFPTDGQAQFVACLSVADPTKGPSTIRETVFENRFQHVSELRRMGAQIEVHGNLAVVQGVSRLSGASVMASDLRASASLVLAGLVAEGTTEILRVYHLDRGYEAIEQKLNAVGAKIERVRT
jgi:UDP-N-acetylglucosamine 1-carboxyvinyltransferase